MDKKAIVKTLNALIETAKDGEYGFRLSAEHAKSAPIKQLFAARSEDCAKAALDLQKMVVQCGGDAQTSGSAGASLHRGWVAVKSTLVSLSDLDMLEEAERGEDDAMAAYRKALREDLPLEVRALVEAQFEAVKRTHDQIRGLRDQARATSP